MVALKPLIDTNDNPVPLAVQREDTSVLQVSVDNVSVDSGYTHKMAFITTVEGYGIIMEDRRPWVEVADGLVNAMNNGVTTGTISTSPFINPYDGAYKYADTVYFSIFDVHSPDDPQAVDPSEMIENFEFCEYAVAYIKQTAQGTYVYISDTGYTDEYGSRQDMDTCTEIHFIGLSDGESTQVEFFGYDAEIPLIAPRVAVTKAAKSMYDTVELRIIYGPMTKVTGITYYYQGADYPEELTDSQYTVNGSEVIAGQNTNIMYICTRSGVLPTINLADDNGAYINIPFDPLKTGSYSLDPVVVTVKKATAQNDTAIFKVYPQEEYYGYELTGLKYKMSGGSYNEVDITNDTAFTYNPPELQLVVFRGLWAGSEPTLEFDNGEGMTYSAKIDIK